MTRGRLPRVRAVLRAASSARASVGFAVLVAAASAVTGTAATPVSGATMRAWGVSVPEVLAGRWWTLLSGALIASGPVQLALVTVVAVAVLGGVERRVGRRVVLLGLTLGALGSVVAGLLVQLVAHAAGAWWPGDLEAHRTLDPAIPVVCALMAASALLEPLWRRRTRLSVGAFVLVFVLYDGDTSDVYRLVASAVGLALGALAARGRPAGPRRPPSYDERRTLLGLVTAVTALGPAVAAVNPSGYGVLTLSGSMLGDPLPPRAEARPGCGTGPPLACGHDPALLALHGVAPLLELFVPLALLAVGAWGLQRGRRFGLRLAVVTDVALAALSVLTLVSPPDGSVDLVLDSPGSGLVELAARLLGPVLIPLAVAALLVRTRGLFPVRTSPGRAVAFWAGSAAAFVLLAGVPLVLGLSQRAASLSAAEPVAVVADVLIRFLPVDLLAGDGQVPLPRAADLVLLWSGPVFWAVVIALAVRALTVRAPFRPAADRDRLDALLRSGGESLAHMSTWPGNRVWYPAGGEAAVAYRLVNDVAVTVSDPVAGEHGLDRTVAEFARFCDRNRWTAAFYCVHDATRLTLAAQGFRSVEVAAEAVLDLACFTTRGKAGSSVRTAINRAAKDGVQGVWSSYAALPLGQRRQLEHLSEEWARHKRLPEMGFTLGGLPELRDPEVRLMIAVDADGRLIGATSWLPVRDDGALVGWTLDLMRRAPAGMPGVMEFLIASVAMRAQEEGLRTLSLSGAPLAVTPGSVRAGPLGGVLAFLSERLEPAYGFTSLLRYKAKFRPRYRPLYLCYRDPLELPAIARAVAGAYLPDVTPSEMLSLARLVARGR